jgi:hypothetical protein
LGLPDFYWYLKINIYIYIWIIFTLNIVEIIAINSLEYLLGNWSYTPFYIFWFNPGKSLALNGGLLHANSYMIHPRDQISQDDW